MNNIFEELKSLYVQVLTLTLEMNVLIKEGKFEQIQKAFEEKDILIKKINELLKNTEFSDEEKNRLNEIIKNIKQSEEENTEILKADRASIGDLLSGINRSHKTISAYKIKKEQEPRLFDVKE